MKKAFLLIASAALLFSCATADKQAPKNTINQEEVMSKLSLEDKAHFVIGVGMAGFSGDNAVIGATQSLVPGAATREGDSATYYCTHFPIGTLLASTWNTQLIEEVGQAIGEEVKEYGADVLLAPALNIMRNPLCGRNFEYYSEDPVVAGKTASAYITGVQKNDVGTSIKHFAASPGR